LVVRCDGLKGPMNPRRRRRKSFWPAKEKKNLKKLIPVYVKIQHIL